MLHLPQPTTNTALTEAKCKRGPCDAAGVLALLAPHTPYLHMSPPGCFLTPQSDGRRDASQLFLPNANGKNPKKKCVAMVAWLVPMSENRKKKTSQKAAGSEEEFEYGD